MNPDSVFRSCQRGWENNLAAEAEEDMTMAIDKKATEIQDDPELMAEAIIDHGEYQALADMLDAIKRSDNSAFQGLKQTVAMNHARSLAAQGEL